MGQCGGGDGLPRGPWSSWRVPGGRAPTAARWRRVFFSYCDESGRRFPCAMGGTARPAHYAPCARSASLPQRLPQGCTTAKKKSARAQRPVLSSPTPPPSPPPHPSFHQAPPPPTCPPPLHPLPSAAHPRATPPYHRPPRWRRHFGSSADAAATTGAAAAPAAGTRAAVERQPASAACSGRQRSNMYSSLAWRSIQAA